MWWMGSCATQVQASSGELMVGLGMFLRRRCRRLRHFNGGEVTVWLRSVDRALLEHAWQDAPFIGPANVVFVYLLARDAVDPDIVTRGRCPRDVIGHVTIQTS